jgi:hypothetical protein
VDIASSSKQVFESRAVTPHPKPNYAVVNDSSVPGARRRSEKGVRIGW